MFIFLRPGTERMGRKTPFTCAVRAQLPPPRTKTLRHRCCARDLSDLGHTLLLLLSLVTFLFQKPDFLCCSSSLDCCEGVGHILCQQSAKPVYFPPTTIELLEGTPRRGHRRSWAPGPDPNHCLCPPPHRTPDGRKGFLFPGTCLLCLSGSLAASPGTALPPEAVVPY